MNCSGYYELIKPKGSNPTYDACVMQGIQNYEKIIAPQLCWPLMKLSVDCCNGTYPKQWICKSLKKKMKNGQRFLGTILIGSLLGSAAILGLINIGRLNPNSCGFSC